jgi:gamma-glutamyl:cysteine ligase YbdK (ATP-grasp superfamily)
MVVDAESLAVRPVVDQVLAELAGHPEMEVELGSVAWSNELARHVIEIKTNGPAADLGQAARDLHAAAAALGPTLARWGARLLPTGMHPLMVPDRDFQLWPTDDEGIYGAFDRIFDCTGHGWSNLQSMHVNLPFADDAQFARLHDAVRTLLPILPGLSASSPLMEGRLCPNLDERLAVYRGNAARVPSVSGQVVPERVHSRAEYQASILEPIYRDLQPLDPEGILRHEWVNARGAIARFDRNAIEIRVLDTQESVRANLAIAHGVVEVLRHAVLGEGMAFQGPLERLAAIFEQVVRSADRTVVDDREYLAALGVSAGGSVRDLWTELLAQVPVQRRDPGLWKTLERILDRGCLARRILTALGGSTEPDAIVAVYRRLAECLGRDELFEP